MTFLVIALLFTILSGYLFNKASGTISLHSPNMMSFIFYFYFILNNVVGAVLVINKLDDHYIINKLSSDIYRYYGYWTILYTIIAFPLGQLLANSLFYNRSVNKLYNRYMTSAIINEPRRIRTHVQVTSLVLSSLSLIAVLYTLVVIGGSPLRSILSGADVMDMALMRADAKSGFGGNEYFRNIFGLTLTPFLSYVAYGYKTLNNNSFNKLWFWTMFIASILILTYDLEKAPVLFYLLGFVFFKVYLGYRLSNKMLFITGGVVLGLVVALYLVLTSYDLKGLFVVNQGIVGRLTLSSNAGVFMSYEVFPRNHDFLGFTSISGFLDNLFDVAQNDRAARIVMEYVNPSGVKAGIAGVFNSLFVSEAWANWGIVGVIVSPIYVGFIIQCLYLFLLLRRKTPFMMALFVFYTIRCAINGGINDYIYNVSTFVMVFVYLIVYHSGESRRRSVKMRKVRNKQVMIKECADEAAGINL